MSGFLDKVSKLFFSSFDQTALLAGVSDIMVVRWDSGQYHATPFLVCFGHHATTAQKNAVRIFVNDKEVKNINFTLDEYGYLHPMRPSQQIIEKLSLSPGQNKIVFELNNKVCIGCEIYLYSEHDKILVSDVDGTLTKNDLGGLFSNLQGNDYLHEGYYELLEAIHKNGYKIVWLTMRSLPLYQFSKQYIQTHTRIHGVLLTQPEQFFPAMKKQLLKQTGNIKTNMMMAIRRLFPSHTNPFIGGLGNRENDAIAYKAAGIPLDGIFIVDQNSKVHHLENCEEEISYKHMVKNIEIYFPKKKMQKTMTMNADIQESQISDIFGERQLARSA